MTRPPKTITKATSDYIYCRMFQGVERKPWIRVDCFLEEQKKRNFLFLFSVSSFCFKLGVRSRCENWWGRESREFHSKSRKSSITLAVGTEKDVCFIGNAEHSQSGLSFWFRVLWNMVLGETNYANHVVGKGGKNWIWT